MSGKQKSTEEERAGGGFLELLHPDFMGSSGELGLQLLVKALIVIGVFLGAVLVCALALLAAMLPLVLAVTGLVSVLAAAAVITGIFVTPDITSLDSFAVNRITTHQEKLLEEVDSYDGKWYWGHYVEEVEVRYEGVTGITSNSDDMLLAYMTEAADADKIMEDDGTAPLLNVNTFSEKWAMRDVLDGMLYISDVKYIKRIREVEAEVPVEEQFLLAAGQFPLLATNTVSGGSSVPGSTATPAPTPAEEEEEVEYETYYKVIITITGMSAEEWVENNGNKEEDSIYAFLEEMFRSFGYHSLGGDEVCQKYLNSDLE